MPAIKEIDLLKKMPLFLADGSTASANARAVELVLGALFTREWNKTPITNFYPCDAIGRLIVGTPYQLTLPEAKSVHDPGIKLLALDPNLAEKFYAPFFGNPILRPKNLISRWQERGKEDEGVAKALRYLASLPATLFVLPDGTPYIQAVIRDRERLIGVISQRLFNSDPAIPLQDKALESLQKVTTIDIIESCSKDSISEVMGSVAYSWKCPECSLGDGDSPSTHVVRFDGKVYKSNGVSRHGDHYREPRCAPYQYFKGVVASRGGIFNINISELVMAGLRPSGKLIYLAEAFCYSNPSVVLAVRSYSDPRGTLDIISREWQGPVFLTPRVYIYYFDQGENRDATGYELVRFLEQGDIAVLSAFVNSLPLVDDGKNHDLVIPQ